MKSFLLSILLLIGSINAFADEFKFVTCGGIADKTEINVNGNLVDIQLNHVNLNGGTSSDFHETNIFKKYNHFTVKDFGNVTIFINNTYFSPKGINVDLVEGDEIYFSLDGNDKGNNEFIYVRDVNNVYYLFLLESVGFYNDLSFLGTNTACTK